MIKINLLPVRQIIRRRQTKKQVFIFLVSIGVLIAGLIIVTLSIGKKISGLKAEVNKLQQKKASYQPMLNEIAKLKNDKLIVERKLAVIEGLKGGRLTMVMVLDDLAERTPSSRLWLKSLTINRERLQLTGVALDNATVAQYMEELGKSELFSGAELSSSSQITMADKKLTNFGLTLSLADSSTSSSENKAK